MIKSNKSLGPLLIFDYQLTDLQWMKNSGGIAID